MLVVSGKSGACISYLTHTRRIEDVSGSLLFYIPLKIYDTLKYFGLYGFVLRMGTDPFLTVNMFYRCSEVG